MSMTSTSARRCALFGTRRPEVLNLDLHVVRNATDRGCSLASTASDEAYRHVVRLLDEYRHGASNGLVTVANLAHLRCG
jgi:hypothetical protein